MRKVDVKIRMMARVSYRCDCWLYQGKAESNRGYKQIWHNGYMRPVHRVSYELHVGEIRAGYEIDHLCRNRSCINPKHLEAVTQAENKRRAGAAVTHCPQGHDYSIHGVWRGRQRVCKTCNNQASARYRQRKLERADL